jgi:hypothetical protein
MGPDIKRHGEKDKGAKEGLDESRETGSAGSTVPRGLPVF